MAIYLIDYDLKDHAQRYDYTHLHQTIMSFGDYIHPLDSTWIVDTSLSPRDMSDRIRNVYQPESHFVSQINPHNALSGWLPTASIDWLLRKGFSV